VVGGEEGRKWERERSRSPPSRKFPTSAIPSGPQGRGGKKRTQVHLTRFLHNNACRRGEGERERGFLSSPKPYVFTPADWKKGGIKKEETSRQTSSVSNIYLSKGKKKEREDRFGGTLAIGPGWHYVGRGEGLTGKRRGCGQGVRYTTLNWLL